MNPAITRIGRLPRLVARSYRLLRDEGPRSLMGRVAGRLARTAAPPASMLVKHEDASLVDWTTTHPAIATPLDIGDRPLDIAWITSPPGKESGGHQNMFRFIKFAEDAGHRCRIYLYDSRRSDLSLADIRAMLASTDAYPALSASIEQYDPTRGVSSEANVLFATGWETAYPAYLDGSPARRLYFVQDFEPSFYPVGSESVLAENTYRFGFHGITAGGWLSNMLSHTYGMKTDHYDFSADVSRYFVENEGPRNEVFFYARPVTARRAFELGILALEHFAAMKPGVTINLAGWDTSALNVPFPHRNHASLELSELNPLYNRCAAGLVLSLTNMSLLPLELLASGVTPVVNDAPNNRMVADNDRIVWTQTSPLAIARALASAYDAGTGGAAAAANAASVGHGDWSDSGAQFISALDNAVRK